MWKMFRWWNILTSRHTLSGKCAATFRDVKNAIKFNKSAHKYLSGLSRARSTVLETTRMVKRKMCVKPMEENEDDKVVSMIVNYFSARVNIADGYREKPRLLQTFAKSVQKTHTESAKFFINNKINSIIQLLLLLRLLFKILLSFFNMSLAQSFSILEAILKHFLQSYVIIIYQRIFFQIFKLF